MGDVTPKCSFTSNKTHVEQTSTERSATLMRQVKYQNKTVVLHRPARTHTHRRNQCGVLHCTTVEAKRRTARTERERGQNMDIGLSLNLYLFWITWEF